MSVTLQPTASLECIPLLSVGHNDISLGYKRCKYALPLGYVVQALHCTGVSYDTFRTPDDAQLLTFLELSTTRY